MSNEILLNYEREGNNGTVKITVRQDKEILFIDKVDIARVSERNRFEEALLAQYPGLDADEVRTQLTKIAADLSGSRSADETDWCTPIPFGQYDLPAFPLEAIPRQLCVIREFCESISHSYQVPIDLAFTLVLAVCGGVLAKRIEIIVSDDWWEPANVYVVVVLESGERKSAVFRVVAQPLADYEQEENARRAPLIEQYRAEMAVMAAQFKQAQSKAAKAEKQDDRDAARDQAKKLAEQMRTTKPVLPLQLIADDATPEAIGQLLHEQEGRIALLSPEGDVFDLMAGRYSKDGVGRLGVYLKGHAGDDYRLNRIGRPSEYVRRPAITCGLAVQPDVIHGLMTKPGLRGRGLLARFFYSMPTSKVGYRDLQVNPVRLETLVAYSRLVKAAIHIPTPVDGNGNPMPHKVRPSPKAWDALYQFRERVEVGLRVSGELSGIRDWGSKLPGLVCRMAGILHALIHSTGPTPGCQPIDAETMLCAIAIGEYAIEHAKAAFCEMGANPATAIAKRILAWAIEERLPEFSRRDAFNAVRGTVQRVDELDEPLQLLVDHGYIRERFIEKTGRGRKPSTLYDLNPALLAQNTQNAHNSGTPDNSANSAHCANEDEA